METHESYMQRAIRLAASGSGSVSPNPLVGCVIVHSGRIIGEGFHKKFGGPHAEAEAIASVADRSMLCESTLYVTLEPCNHFGKTPPCTRLILDHKIPLVVIGTHDPNQAVGGKGAEALRQNGCVVVSGMLEEQCRFVNRRFLCYHENRRPWIILKWAQTSDAYIDHRGKYGTGKPGWITSEYSKQLVHKWRSEEDAIMVGTRTALVDNPRLNTREWRGKDPLRIVVDRFLELPENLNLFDHSIPTLCFTEKNRKAENNLEFVCIDFSRNINVQIMEALYERRILSVIIEGGTQLLSSFINMNLWDEARVFTAMKEYRGGTPAPVFEFKACEETPVAGDLLKTYFNPSKTLAD